MEHHDAAPVMAAPSSATMLTARSFAADLLQACEMHDHLLLDISPVTQADISFVQILHAAHQQMQQKGGSFALSQPVGDYLTDLFRKAGISSDDCDADFWFKGTISQ